MFSTCEARGQLLLQHNNMTPSIRCATYKKDTIQCETSGVDLIFTLRHLVPAKRLHCLLFFLDSVTLESRILGMSCVCSIFFWLAGKQTKALETWKEHAMPVHSA